METQPFTGIRIVDMTWWLGSYTGKLFGDLGAEVIRVEPPEGLPDRHGASGDETPGRFAFLNASKKSIALDLDSEEGRRQFRRLLSTSRVVLLERGGPYYDRIEEILSSEPHMIVTVISPFGMTGPRANDPASDLTIQAAGGIAWMSGRIEREPLKLPFGQSTMVASIYAATVTAIALRDAEHDGTGHLIEVSAQECIAHSLQNAIQVWDLEQRVSIRGGEGTRDASEDVFPCRDGFVFLAAPLALGRSWAGLVEWINELNHPSGPELASERWSDREWRLTREAREAFRGLFSAFTLEHDKSDLAKEAIQRRVVLAPVNRFSDLLEDEQLAHRRFFRVQSDGDGNEFGFPGPPYHMSRPVWRTAPAPRLNENAAIMGET